jgi:excinuclease ABC subunit A
VIEHNLEVIKTADWIIDLGPEGGDGGGEIVAAGTPEDVVKVKRSYTGQFLKPVLAAALSSPRKRGPSNHRPRRSGHAVRTPPPSWPGSSRPSTRC